MKSKSFMLMILSMGFGLIAAIGISQVMGRNKANNQPVQKMGPVLVAADFLDVNTLLTEENVKIENWPKKIIPEDAITKVEDLKEMCARTPLSKGMPIVSASIINEKLINKLHIPDGFKVVSLKVSGDDLIAGLLNPGDKVDLIGYFRKRTRSGEQQQITRTFQKAVRVFSINSRTTTAENRAESGTTGGAILSLLVTERQSEEIYFVKKTGEIKVVLRGNTTPEDDQVDDISDIINWNTETEQEVVAKEIKAPIQPASKKAQMIVWQADTPQIVSFTPGQLPTSTGPAGPEPPPGSTPPGEAGSLNGDEFDGSEEIDRGLDQDQYPGE